MPKKTTRKRRSVLASYQKNESYVKGLLFEVVLKELVRKSGFSQEHLSQANAKDTKLHGRSAVHQIDILGVFRLGIPFINPLLLVGEAKNFKRKVTIKEAREFLGMFVDITQYPRIQTKSRSSIRSEQTLQPRYTYCPVYFSLKGYQESAQHFMYSHGINFFSYENSEIMDHLDKNIHGVLTQIRFQKLNSRDFKTFKDLASMQNIPSDVKKEGFDRNLSRLITYLSSVSSYVGVLDKRFPIHILTRKKNTPKKSGEVKLQFLQRNSFVLKTMSNRQIGQFSLPSMFVSRYISMAKRQNIIDNIFRQIDVIVPTEENLFVINFRINEQYRSVIIGFFEKNRHDITQIQSALQEQLSSE